MYEAMERLVAQALAGPEAEWVDGGLEAVVERAASAMPAHGKIIRKALYQKRGPFPVRAVQLLAAAVPRNEIMRHVRFPSVLAGPAYRVFEQMGVPASVVPTLVETVNARLGKVIERGRGRRISEEDLGTIRSLYRLVLYRWLEEHGFKPQWEW